MKKIITTLFFCGVISNSVFADAPVVDYSSNANSNLAQQPAITSIDSSLPAKTNLSVEQRIDRLEQQINHINGQNLSGKIEELQRNLQTLNGKLEAQAHQIEQLNKQLKDFYQDLNQRLGVAKPTQTQIAVSPASNSSVVDANATTDSAIVPATTSNIAGAFSNSPSATNINTDNAFLKEQQAYQTAIDLLPDKKHESENKLRDYLKQYPKGVYVANAHYWLGEINFLQKNFDAAEEEFKVVVTKYAKSKRVSDALLKLALVHQNQGRDAKQVRQELQKIVKNYPGTSAAQLAKQQLMEK